MPWHQITDPQDPKLDQLAVKYHLHPLHIEDCRHRRQRAKIEERPEYFFVVLKPVEAMPDGELNFPDFDIFVGRDFCITVTDGKSGVVREALARCERLAAPHRPDEIFYRLFDSIVDSYLPATDQINDRIDDLEDKIVDDPSPEAMQDIFHLKRALIDLRRVLVNTRDVGMHLQREPGALISPDLFPFFRDIYDHIARNLDLVETARDILNGSLDVYLSSVSNRTNQVMKVLTLLSTIALPALVITGVYGMNLKGIPFIDSPHGIYLVVGTIIVTTALLLWGLKKMGWF